MPLGGRGVSFYPTFMPPHIHPLGDQGLLIDWGNRLDPGIAQQVQACWQRLQALHLPGVLDLVPAYSSLALLFDLDYLLKNYPQELPYALVKSWVEPVLVASSIQPLASSSRNLDIPVCFEVPHALDLAELAAQKRLSPAAFIQQYCQTRYQVYMIGFLPGFAYLGILDDLLATPRKTTPRSAIPAGSVGIAGAQTGIYPLDSPGGWQIIGRCPWRLFTPANDPPVRLQMGDWVQFYPISSSEFMAQNEHPGT